MKYLIPVKMKNVLVSTEEGKIYGVSKIVEENNLMNDKQPEIAYVLTDNDFIIKLLRFNVVNSHSNVQIFYLQYIFSVNIYYLQLDKSLNLK